MGITKQLGCLVCVLGLLACAGRQTGARDAGKASQLPAAPAAVRAQTDAPAPAAVVVAPADPSSDGNQWLNMSLLSPNRHYRCGQTGELYAVIDLRAAEIPMDKRLPLNLSLVIDRSGSMEAEGKLEYVKQAAAYLVKNMLASDVLSVVVYDDKVQVASRAAPVDDPKQVLRLIESLRPGNLTYIEGGLRAGATEVDKNLDVERINRVLLLSDGLANVGIQDPAGIGRIARSFAERGISATAMGVGTSYSEQTMMLVAEYGRGNYHFIGEPNQIAEIFRAELDELKAVVVQQAELSLELPQGVSLEGIYGYEDARKLAGAWQLPMGDLFSGDDRRVVVRLGLNDPRLRSFELRSTMHYRPAESGAKGQSLQTRLSMDCVESEAALAAGEDMEVREEVAYVVNEHTVDVAMRQMNEGHAQIAKDELDRRIQLVAPLAEKSDNARLKEQVKELEQARSRMEQLDDMALQSEEVQTYIKGNRARSKKRQKKSQGGFRK